MYTLLYYENHWIGSTSSFVLSELMKNLNHNCICIFQDWDQEPVWINGDIGIMEGRRILYNYLNEHINGYPWIRKN